MPTGSHSHAGIPPYTAKRSWVRPQRARPPTLSRYRYTVMKVGCAPTVESSKCRTSDPGAEDEDSV